MLMQKKAILPLICAVAFVSINQALYTTKPKQARKKVA